MDMIKNDLTGIINGDASLKNFDLVQNFEAGDRILFTDVAVPDGIEWNNLEDAIRVKGEGKIEAGVLVELGDENFVLIEDVDQANLSMANVVINGQDMVELTWGMLS